MTTQPPDPARPCREVAYGELLSGLRRFLRTEGRRYLDDPNIASIGLGYRAVEGRGTGELVVQFTVLETCAVPETVTLAGVRVPTDVRERRAQPAPAAPAAPARPDHSDRSGRPDPAERRGPTGLRTR
ncbi:hypothetical protein [Geodermatophilus chilensis]|uniref:hypothetical protein n=1 Tax=Geodermatophilus chilensis TaxID=2035835 RepID=UPI00130007E4|nr:hypothetical protein [Geodermatophilus chilensis]